MGRTKSSSSLSEGGSGAPVLWVGEGVKLQYRVCRGGEGVELQ